MSHQAVLTVHDTVAQKNFDPMLPPLPDDLDDELEEESIKIVRLVKSKEPLVSVSTCSPCNVLHSQQSRPIIISDRVHHGMAAINQIITFPLYMKKEVNVLTWSDSFIILQC